MRALTRPLQSIPFLEAYGHSRIHHLRAIFEANEEKSDAFFCSMLSVM